MAIEDSSTKKLICYTKHDNDIYWLHFPNQVYFYVFPEFVLIEEGRIYESESKPVSKNMYFSVDESMKPTNRKWDKYLFDYNDLDVPRLQNLFNSSCV